MMYISTLLVNTGDNPDRPRPGRLWLRNIYHVHQRLSMAFPSRELKEGDPMFLKPFDPQAFERPRFLFRIDRGIHDEATRTVILIQSELSPDWAYAFQNAPGLLSAPPQARPLEWSGPIGDRYRFRLLANPTAKRDGKRFPCWYPTEEEHRRGERRDFEDECRKWLKRKGEQHGFDVDRNMLRIQTNGLKQGRRPEFVDDDKKSLRFAAVQFDGILTVTDKVKFETALRGGIGSGKAFGCGLLSVLPVT